MGSLVQIKYCKRCEAYTYHRYINPLRNVYVVRASWECVSCGERARKQSATEYAV